jgi:phosphoribosylformylglycinamidine synthase
MRSSVIVFPGSNCDRDMAAALNKFGFKNSMVWHNDNEIPKSDLVVLPGGFSYGDYLRTGCIASKSKIIKRVIEFAKNGGLVLGICNGFQILIEAGLLPGTLVRNKKLKFICKNVHLKITNNSNNFFSKFEHDVLKLNIAHNDGCYYVDKKTLKKLEDNNQIVFKYSDEIGKVEDKNNPNGSIGNIAGILNVKENILGMMPHPERMIDKSLSGEDGSLFFNNLLKKYA